MANDYAQNDSDKKREKPVFSKTLLNAETHL